MLNVRLVSHYATMAEASEGIAAQKKRSWANPRSFYVSEKLKGLLIVTANADRWITCCTNLFFVEVMERMIHLECVKCGKQWRRRSDKTFVQLERRLPLETLLPIPLNGFEKPAFSSRLVRKNGTSEKARRRLPGVSVDDLIP